MPDRAAPRALTRRGFAGEVALLLVVGALLTLLFTRLVYPALGLPTRGPVPLRTLGLVAGVGLFLQRRGAGWRDLGLGRPASLSQTLFLAVALVAAKVLLFQRVADTLRLYLGLPPADLSFFDHLVGNRPALAAWLVLAWGAAFAEEILVRGYLMGGLLDLLAGRRHAATAAPWPPWVTASSSSSRGGTSGRRSWATASGTAWGSSPSTWGRRARAGPRG
jgi:membrane protease YdiL (CAAX protease family)